MSKPCHSILLNPTLTDIPLRQFGNMLVLAATYNSSLSELVKRSTLDRLFKRTIRFLLRYGNASAALRADTRILNQIYSKLFGGPPVLTDA